MELGPQNHYGDGLMGPNSIIVVYTDPLGSLMTLMANYVAVEVQAVGWYGLGPAGLRVQGLRVWG